MIWFVGWVPVDESVLGQDGTDLVAAADGRVPLDDQNCQLLLRMVNVGAGWREIYDGPVPEIGYDPGAPRPRCLVFAAPDADNWMTVTFQQQDDGSWSTLLQPGLEVYDE